MNNTDDNTLMIALLDAAVDAIIVCDSHGTIQRLNKAASQLFGWSLEALRGQNVRVLMPASIAAKHDGFMSHHLTTGEQRIIGIGRDVQGLHTNGTIFPLHISIGRADIGGDAAFVAILHDQTRRKAAEDAAARSQRMDAIGQMTGGIAHDFNNLLTVVIGNLELLDMAETSDRSHALISDALEAAELGADLTSRLMVFARKSTLQSEIIMVNHVIEQTLVMLKRTITAHVTISSVLEKDVWPIRADATQLQMAVLNLALNAQDAMPQGGRIVVETRNVALDDDYMAQEIGVEPGRYVCLSVRDTGEGMTDETRRRAMEPFFTTKRIGKGTGLGLSMVYGFVKQSNGHITIYSELGHGTTINLYFPALIGEDEAQIGILDAGDADADLGVGQTVLVVEDDPRVMRVSQARLAALGFHCILAKSGDAAWDLLQIRNDITLVFTDLVMPGTLSGYDLAQRVAQQKPGICVLMTSGFSENALKGGRIGAEFAILRKPYRQADLAAALQAVFDDK